MFRIVHDGINRAADNSKIYYDDEMDYYTIAEYLCSCEAIDNDIRFLESPCFALKDFTEGL